MNHWGRQLKDFVKKKCKGILTISMICSLYASVQGINDSPLSPTWGGAWFTVAFYNQKGRQHLGYRPLINQLQNRAGF
jgi:hypothetical protein